MLDVVIFEEPAAVSGRARQTPGGSEKPIGKQDVALPGCGGEAAEHELRFRRNERLFHPADN